MFIKRVYKNGIWIPLLLFVASFYIILRLSATCCIEGSMDFEVLSNIKLTDYTQIVKGISLGHAQTMFTYAGMGSCFALMIYYHQQMTYKNNVDGSTFGTAEWGNPKDVDKIKDKDITKNIILTQTEQVSKNMRVTSRNRNIILLGRPGTGKTRYFFKPNLLNMEGTKVVTDPKGEMLRDCGYALRESGYTIKVLNLDQKFKSNNYNPLMYLRKIPKEALKLERQASWDPDQIAEDDVMSLINVIIQNTQSDNIESSSGDPFWEKAEMIFLQAIIYYVIFNEDLENRTFRRVLELIRLSNPDENGNSQLNQMFEEWKEHDEYNIGVKQWEHFMLSAGSPKMMSTIILTATARLASLNIAEVEDLISSDNMELDRIGKEGDEGKIIYFVITKPGDSAFNFIANIMYTQIFSIIDRNAAANNGSLATPCDLYMDEWAQLGEIPRFVEQTAYVRGLNVGIVISLQSLSQLKKVYKDSWETLLDCCDYILFLGSQSKETLEYLSLLFGKKTWYKKNSSQTFGSKGSNSRTWDEVGRELATVDELARLEKGKCLLKIVGYHIFYSDLYDLSKHPNANMLFEPWREGDEENLAKKYDHRYMIEQVQRETLSKNYLATIGFFDVNTNQKVTFV